MIHMAGRGQLAQFTFSIKQWSLHWSALVNQSAAEISSFCIVVDKSAVKIFMSLLSNVNKLIVFLTIGIGWSKIGPGHQ